MSLKILVTGAKGMLGTDLCALLSEKHKVIAVDIDVLDITQQKSVIDFVNGVSPQLIINCAAATNVDGCETDIDKAYLINAIGARNLAAVSDALNAPLVHYSTDYVFDGKTDTPYTEFDRTNPQSVYGKSKLAGEEYIRSLTNRYFIIRTQWLYGKNGGNFVKTIRKIAVEKGAVTVVSDQKGCPTYTKDLSAATASLIETAEYGTYHITNQGIVSWYEFTCEIMKQSGLSNVKTDPCTTAQMPRPAKRPAYSPLDNYCLKLMGMPLLRPFDAALADYLS